MISLTRGSYKPTQTLLELQSADVVLRSFHPQRQPPSSPYHSLPVSSLPLSTSTSRDELQSEGQALGLSTSAGEPLSPYVISGRTLTTTWLEDTRPSAAPEPGLFHLSGLPARLPLDHLSERPAGCPLDPSASLTSPEH